MNYPKDLLYTKDHEWVRVEGSLAKVGISAYALEQLSDVVHLDLPKIGQQFEAGESFGSVESTKTVSDLYMPTKAEIVGVNQSLIERLEELNKDPYGLGWLVQIRVFESPKELMNAEEYKSYLGV